MRTSEPILAGVSFILAALAPISMNLAQSLQSRSADIPSPLRAGDHVAFLGNTFADQLRIHGYLETLLLQHWPDNPVSIRHLGWGGDMLTARDRPTGFPAEEVTLREHQTDVIVACFGMGESFDGQAGLANFKADVAEFIAAHAGKSYNGVSEVRLILISPIAYEDLGDLTPAHERRNLELRSYSQALGEVAEKAGIPFVDLNQPTRYLMDEPLGPNFTTNGIHLNAFGYWAVSHILYRKLVAERPGDDSQPWGIAIDAQQETLVSARGVVVSDLERSKTGLRFRVTELNGPSFPPPTDRELPPQLAFQRDTLTVKNLPAGSHTLIVDGERVVAATHERWAEGVPIDASPTHRAAEFLRQSVIDKNLQFTYGWKALNQVHIVGERKSSPSGRALPSEIVEFKRLADEREKQLRGKLERTTRTWQLQP